MSEFFQTRPVVVRDKQRGCYLVFEEPEFAKWVKDPTYMSKTNRFEVLVFENPF